MTKLDAFGSGFVPGLTESQPVSPRGRPCRFAWDPPAPAALTVVLAKMGVW